MIATVLIVASAAILFALGAMHVVLTFHGNRLAPRDPGLKDRMAQVSPGITSEATMWSFWIGFNVSHGMAAMLFGLIYGYLALAHGSLLFASPYLRLVGFATLVAFLVVARLYWFRAPLIGIGISFLCYVVGMVALLA